MTEKGGLLRLLGSDETGIGLIVRLDLMEPGKTEKEDQDYEETETRKTLIFDGG